MGWVFDGLVDFTGALAFDGLGDLALLGDGLTACDGLGLGLGLGLTMFTPRYRSSVLNCNFSEPVVLFATTGGLIAISHGATPELVAGIVPQILLNGSVIVPPLAGMAKVGLL